MPAIIFNLELDQGRTNSLNFRWLDRNDNPVDLTGWGAIAEIRTVEGLLVSKITSSDEIILLTPNPGGVDFNADAGRIFLNFPANDLLNPPSFNCEWELVLYPSVGSPRTNPQSLLRGTCDIRKQIVIIE